MSKSFDQIVKGSITIKKCKKKNYKITFCTNNQFLRYQVWCADDNAVNSSRTVYKQSANNWVNQFNELNASLKASNKPLFSPTTTMELGYDKYVFVIHKAKINDNGNMVFSVLTNEINLSDGTSKKMITLPCGKYDGVRFDIDHTPPTPSFGTSLGGTNGSSWSLCFTYEQNTNPPGNPTFLGPQGPGGTCWSYWGYSSSPWYINGPIGNTNTSGFLFIYNNYDDCGSAPGADNGPSQLYIASYSSQINALNDPVQSIGGSLSQALIQYSPGGYMNLLQGLNYDDTAIYYVQQPQSATISSSIGSSPTFSLSSLPPISIGDIQYGQLNIQTQLSKNLTCNNTQGLYTNPTYINPSITNCQPDGAASLEYDFLGIPTGNINLSDQCTFTLTLTQNFYQNYNGGSPYAYAATPFTFSITIDQ